MTNVRAIPSIERLRGRPVVVALEARFGPTRVVEALRVGAERIREDLRATADTESSEEVAIRIEHVATEHLTHVFRPSLVSVVNATGVIVHTNLGRAPLAAAAIERVVQTALGYSNLEYDLARGSRGRRDVHAEALLCRLTGAEAAVVVNNNAAATMLILAAVASGREVVVSRGELVEIGGGFRVPEVMAQSGARLREVGTTNRTRAADYAAAVNERTALILRVHPSNFRIEGFTQRPTLGELVALGRQLGVPVAEDLGSGLLDASVGHPLRFSEPTVRATVEAGADLCCFSGDKLLGGPQAGIVVGRAVIIDTLRRHPLMRALRVDKMTYAALEGTLVEYAADRSDRAVPVQRMLTVTEDELLARAERLASLINVLDGWRAEVRQGMSAVGGGSAPGVELPTWLVQVEARHLSTADLELRLRQAPTAIVARIIADRLVLDLRTVLPDQDQLLAATLAAI